LFRLNLLLQSGGGQLLDHGDRVWHTNEFHLVYTLADASLKNSKVRPARESESHWSVGWAPSLYLLRGRACISILRNWCQLGARAGNSPQQASSGLSKHFYEYLTSKPLSPDLVEMSECSTPDTDAAEGPLFKCWTNCWIASSLPCASPWTCAALVLA
jgi:hypothetical protein